MGLGIFAAAPMLRVNFPEATMARRGQSRFPSADATPIIPPAYRHFFFLPKKRAYLLEQRDGQNGIHAAGRVKSDGLNHRFHVRRQTIVDVALLSITCIAQ